MQKAGEPENDAGFLKVIITCIACNQLNYNYSNNLFLDYCYILQLKTCNHYSRLRGVQFSWLHVMQVIIQTTNSLRQNNLLLVINRTLTA